MINFDDLIKEETNKTILIGQKFLLIHTEY